MDIYKIMNEYLIDIRDQVEEGKRDRISINDKTACFDILEWLNNQDMLKKARE